MINCFGCLWECPFHLFNDCRRWIQPFVQCLKLFFHFCNRILRRLDFGFNLMLCLSMSDRILRLCLNNFLQLVQPISSLSQLLVFKFRPWISNVSKHASVAKREETHWVVRRAICVSNRNLASLTSWATFSCRSSYSRMSSTPISWQKLAKMPSSASFTMDSRIWIFSSRLSSVFWAYEMELGGNCQRIRLLAFFNSGASVFSSDRMCFSSSLRPPSRTLHALWHTGAYVSLDPILRGSYLHDHPWLQ